MGLKRKTVIAVNQSELHLFGCPSCGYRSGSCHLSFSGCGSWTCGECRFNCTILADGVEKSAIGTSVRRGTIVYPIVSPHPRIGIPARGKKYKRHKDGEFFWSRGIGMDITPGCLVCGGERGLHNNICGFVQNKEAGERVVSMFQSGAWLDFREHEPDRVQVKIGACKQHLENLKKLEKTVREFLKSEGKYRPGVINENLIKDAIST